MEKGTFKVFSHLAPWFEEKMNYHRDEDGKIVKVADDLLAATRYAYMMRRFAVQKAKVGAVTAAVKVPKNRSPRKNTNVAVRFTTRDSRTCPPRPKVSKR